MNETETSNTPARGAHIMISYEKLLSVEAKLIAIDSKLMGALALKGIVDDLGVRVIALESILEGEQAVVKYRSSRGKVTMALLTGALGGGALTFLPQILGWLNKLASLISN